MAPSPSGESQVPSPLVGTKLRARVEVRDCRERSRLSAQLDAALDDTTRLTLLSAPPGYGKEAEHGPPFVHLVLQTREDPPLPLARLRAQGRLVELRTDDLRLPGRPGRPDGSQAMGARQPGDGQDRRAVRSPTPTRSMR